MALSKQDIKNAKDIRTEEVNVPEWGGTVFVRTMTGKARDAVEMAIFKSQQKKTPENVRGAWVAAAACDENGKPIFQQSDADWLGDKSASALDRCFEAVQRLNGITDADVEELAKN